MKRSLFFAMLFLGILSFSCKNKALEQLNQKNQELTRVTRERDSLISQLYTTMDEFEKNLGILKVSNSERGGSLTDRIKLDLDHIKSMIKSYEKKSDSLRRIVGNSRSRNNYLLQRMDTLNQELSKRETAIDNLNSQISDLNSKVTNRDSAIAGLTNKSRGQQGTIQEMVNRINTAHYIVGDKKDLVSKKIIVKEGGLLGIGKVERLNPRFNRSEFKTINIQNDTTITLNIPKNNVDIVTVHPPESYTLEPEGKNRTRLEIKNPEEFWEASKFLVVAND